MPVTQATPFSCPNCAAEYKLVQVETKAPVSARQMACRKCGGLLPRGEGRLVLRYFLLAHRARRRLRGGLAKDRPKNSGEDTESVVGEA
jgi:hypothetical protein